MYRSLPIAGAAFAAACQPASQESPSPPGQGGSSLPGSGAATAGVTPATYSPDVRPDGVAGSAGARLEGKLTARGGCLLVDVGGGRVFQPVFPVGRVRWEKSTERLFIDGAVHRLGDRIALGGGGLGDRETFAGASGATIPPCNAELFVVSL